LNILRRRCPPVNIHPLAIVSPKAQIAANVSIGPFSVVEADVTIGEGCELASHVVIKDGTRLGPRTVVHEAAILGGLPQHINKPKQPGLLLIGANNTIREHATLHRAMKAEAATIVGDGNFLMAGVHVAHDCRIGNQVIFANNALLAGHVVVEDRAFVSGAVGVHQFCRIGRLAMVGAHAKVVQDVPPYVTIDGISGCVVGLNLVGLRRGGFTSDEIVQLKKAYRLIYRRGLKWSEVLEQLKIDFPAGPAAVYFEFLSGGTRGFVQDRRMPPGATIKLRPNTEENEQSDVVYRAKAG
jgi:UDP-N-acetylglucosamine acyltransferase